ncbi:MAG: tRNA (N(6)-L-threonylcarbamoyladenosine(37)-C(2))-methylthiotransferase MtaB [Chlorobiaceae bacterium]|nr:tRNA (N(6)-L-threonylcarbamoyladenosine(37)-C(2))-methylthiotransferase MtaB [Chlorobiaceae bacterium]NTW10485.1 tRNA (N(6)-L-threonylcarbamoyladenosine(37)-C(2))-methylthiotransferase MtaB [Chlorobiaceae bacterium]
MKSAIKSVAAITLGCKLNYAETSSIVDNLCNNGWSVSAFDDAPDLIIIHTCAVTNQAEQKCRQRIRKIIRENPSSRIAVAGCYAQLNSKALEGIEGIDVILGNEEKFDLQIYENLFDSPAGQRVVRVTPASGFEKVHQGYSLRSEEGRGRTRAFLKIQDGCDYGCAYCTIPAARGRSRSIASALVIGRAEELASAGYREIVLTGVNSGDYRYDGVMFKDLLRMLEKVAVSRIRISSVEPDFLDDQLISLVGASEKIVPHFHVPLQSGSDAILKAMRRRYDTAGYRERVLKALELVPDCAIGADVMVGYPGETETEFNDMLRFIETLPIAYLHVFSCSVRPGTDLAMEVRNRERALLDPGEISRRQKALGELGKKKEEAFNARYLGSEGDVLFEESRKAGAGRFLCTGYTRNYLRVSVESETDLSGKELRVAIERPGEDLILGGRLLS